VLRNVFTESPGGRSPETIVCACRKTTCGRLLEMFESAPQASFGQLKELYRIGDRCTSCEIEVRDMLHDFQTGRLKGRPGRLPLRLRLRLFRQRRQAFREAKERQKTALRRAGLFVISDDRIESVLVLANVGFPEDQRNANGRRVEFKALLYDAGGQSIAESDQSLPNGASRDYTLEQLFPNAPIPKPFVGCLYLDFYRLWELGSLRPYCLFRDKKGSSLWHYHDKYRGVQNVGYYHASPVFLDGRRCWLMACNLMEKPYSSRAFLSVNGQTLNTEVEITGMGTLWAPLDALFRTQSPPAQDPTSVFWLENRDPIMVWFAWEKPGEGIWTVQHH
jgi:bacterioferritin-associated ferredoxin